MVHAVPHEAHRGEVVDLRVGRDETRRGREGETRKRERERKSE
jgi:hypothetical protein